MKHKSTWTLPSPDQAIRQLWAAIPSYTRLTFLSSMVLGLCAHLYMLTNKLPNHDDLTALFDCVYGTPSGRWLLPTIVKLDGNYSMPWLIGLLGILCLSAAACFTTALLRIHHPAGCILTAGLMVSFPAVTATFTYMFSADSYFFAIALAAFGAYAAVRLPKVGVPLGVLSITLSLGIYQSYFGVAAALMVGALLFETLDGKQTFQALFLKGVKLVATLGVAMAAYMILVKLTTRDTGVVDYMGLSTMGQINLAELPTLILRCYTKYSDFLLQDPYHVQFRFLGTVFVFAAVCAAVLLFLLLFRRYRNLGPLRTALSVVLALLYPMAANLIYIMVPAGAAHFLMIYGMYLITVLPLALTDYACSDPAVLPALERSARSAMGWVCVISMSLAVYSNMIASNKVYLKMELSYQQCVSYSTRLLSAIESCKGYERGLPVALVGSTTQEAALFPTPQLNDILMTGVQDLAQYRSAYSYNLFLNYCMGFSSPVYLDGSSEVSRIAALPEVQKMPLYPQTGSIQIIDGMVVVKFN